MENKFTPEERETLESYGKVAEIWDERNPCHWKDELWYAFASRLPDGARVLDLGCGTARDAEFFLTEGFRYVGVDFSLPMLQVAARHLLVPFLGMNIGELAFRSESFDAFWATTSFMHVPRKKLPFVLGEVQRVLKPKGIGFISIPSGTFEGMYEGQGSFRDVGSKTLCVCWPPEDLEAVLVASGFTVLKWIPIAYMLYFIVQREQ